MKYISIIIVRNDINVHYYGSGLGCWGQVEKEGKILEFYRSKCLRPI